MNYLADIECLMSRNANIFCVRMPGDNQIISGYSSKLTATPTPGCFAISTFDGDISFISSDYTEAKSRLTFPSRLNASTTRPEYDKGLESIVADLKISGGKTVYSRVINLNKHIDIPILYEALCTAYPAAYVFMYRTTKHGLWIGASPELLMNARKGEYHTMSLAGTRPTGSIEAWDAKNLEEQQMVTDFITSTISKYFNMVVKQPIETRNAGPVEHLCTKISAAGLKPDVKIFSMLSDLSPTPALCGLPRDKARMMIQRHEQHNRMCYGGYTGLYFSPDHFDFYVNLRSMAVADTALNIFVGGGLTHLSEADNEWLETERKASTLLALINR